MELWEGANLKIMSSRQLRLGHASKHFMKHASQRVRVAELQCTIFDLENIGTINKRQKTKSSS